jgi:NAD(P)-dependent dehydrogenase (short-subunit alcohol dehydrogenase family)
LHQSRFETVMKQLLKRNRSFLYAAAAGGLAAVLLVRQSRKRNGLDGQVVLITGGSRGLGLALAREFASHGSKIAICGRDEGRLRTAQQILSNEGADVLSVPCDVSDRSQVEQMISAVHDRYGRIDILVNNAGQIRVAPLEDTTLEDFEKAMDVMFWGVVYPTLAVLPEMTRRKAGRIAIITSIGGKVSIPHLLPYSCAKFAAVGFCEGLRAETARHGIQVTAVVPGLMRTGSHRNAEFGGESRQEAAWFGLSATLPVLAMDAGRAARRITRSIQYGKSEKFLTPHAKLLAGLHGISPGFVTDALGYVNRLLPSSSGGQHSAVRGADVEDQQPEWWRAATWLGRRAASQLNQ